MATTLKQIQSQKQKLAPKQVLNARLLQLNVVKNVDVKNVRISNLWQK